MQKKYSLQLLPCLRGLLDYYTGTVSIHADAHQALHGKSFSLRPCRAPLARTGRFCLQQRRMHTLPGRTQQLISAFSYQFWKLDARGQVLVACRCYAPILDILISRIVAAEHRPLLGHAAADHVLPSYGIHQLRAGPSRGQE